MRRRPLIVVLGLALGAGNVAANTPVGTAASYTVDVAVQSVTPRYRYDRVQAPVRSCRLEPVRVHYPQAPRYRSHHYSYRHDDYPARADAGAVLLGGLIGGLLGNRVGDGHGRPALTIAGAALGATVAGDLSRQRHRYDDYPYRSARVRHHYEQRYEERCSRVQRARQVRVSDGYDVTYRYNGQTFSKWLPEHPGATLPIAVSVTPLP